MTTPDLPEPRSSEEGHTWAADAGAEEATEPGGADVVDLAKHRRPGPASPADAEPDPDNDTDDTDDTDRESVAVGPATLGVPVDPPESDRAPVASGGQQRRAPVVPTWLRSGGDARAVARHAARNAGYVVAFHLVRSPKYAAKTLVWALVGAVRIPARLVRWASAEEGNWSLRQDAARRNDPEAWLKLDRQRQRQSSTRWPLLIAGTVATVAAYAVAWYGPWPWPTRWVLVAATVVVLARLGRPADKPITDRVSSGPAYRKLTAELVRRALTSLQLGGINQAVAKDPGAISFPVEIHRDGPGHLAIVDLPYGVEAADVVARRGRLASGLRLPLDQVWPEPAPGHTGRLALWVGFEPASKMRQPAWPLARSGQVDLFEPFPFATTPRMETVTAGLMARNWLFGGQPGSGKTFAMLVPVLAAALDPRAELRGYEFKGVGDFAVVAPLCAEYGNGAPGDDDTLAACAAMFDWLLDECRRRSARINYYRGRGLAPKGAVTPELASLPGSGLHPLVVFIDEIQELILSKWGKELGDKAERVIKLGRALGVILLIGTQIPDKDSLPTGITRNVNTRFCLSVADHVANDMILGTGAHKAGYRATVFEPVVDAGWGILTGFGKPGARRTFEIDAATQARVVARATALRAEAGMLPDPAGQARQTAPAYDLLTDLATVWPTGEDKAWNEVLCTRLADLRPEVYTGWESAQLTAAVKPHGIRAVDVGRRIDGKAVTRRGITHADITTAVTERSRKRVGG